MLILVPTMNSLTIEATSLSNFLAQTDANFPFKTPLHVQALDSNNRVITDGPDSILVSMLSAIDILNKCFGGLKCMINGVSSFQGYIVC